MNFAKKRFSYNIAIPKLTIIGDYEMEGYLLKEIVQGVGKANITIRKYHFLHYQSIFAEFSLCRL